MCVACFLPVSVKWLLESGVSPDVTNEDGLTALHQVRFNVTAVYLSAILSIVSVLLILSVFNSVLLLQC